MKTFSARRGTWTVEHVHQWRERKTLPTFVPVKLLDKTTRIAIIGSCFSRSVAKNLSKRGFVANIHPAGLWYNTISIEQEIRHLLDPDSSSYDGEGLWKTADGRWIHPFKAYDRSFTSESELLEWSSNLDIQARTLFLEADLIIITIGLAEIWESALGTGNAFLQIPPPDIHKKDIAKFRITTVSENMTRLEHIYQLIRRHTHADLILAVGPGRLSATFSPLDVRIANNLSKSILCSAVSEFLTQHPDVYYFHSFEIVNCDDHPMRFFENDGRHVHEVGVELIIDEFIRCFGNNAGKAMIRNEQDFLMARLRLNLGRSLMRLRRKLQQKVIK